MTPGFKGVLWVALILSLWGAACKAKAEPAPTCEQETNLPPGMSYDLFQQ